MLNQLIVVVLLLLGAGGGVDVATSMGNMNGEYLISGDNGFNTNYSAFPLATTLSENNSYIDVVSAPLTTHYGQVYWTMMEPIPLDPEFVKRFDGKTMAITGYEVDQVFANGTSVPITWASVKQGLPAT